MQISMVHYNIAIHLYQLKMNKNQKLMQILSNRINKFKIRNMIKNMIRNMIKNMINKFKIKNMIKNIMIIKFKYNRNIVIKMIIQIKMIKNINTLLIHLKTNQ